MKTVSVLGNLRWTPANTQPGSVGDFPLSVAQLVIGKVQADSINLVASVPISLALAVPASVVGLRVPSGSSVDLIVTSASGTSQKVPVTSEALLVSPGAPYTAVSLQSAADVAGVEYLVG